jgi:hypothetical protein
VAGLPPYWEGRTPSRFDTGNVSVQGGVLRLLSTTDVEDLVEVEDPEQDVWVRSACVASGLPIASHGYYEARIKASRLSMTSSFWLQGRYSEIDVVEQLGEPIVNPWKRGYMLANTHYFKDGWENDRKTPVKWEMPAASAEKYHVYGLWWVDENTVRFYHDGQQVIEVETGGAFLEPMYLFFDTEVFAWEGLPTVESLRDPERNAMLVDWVRAWKLGEVKE